VLVAEPPTSRVKGREKSRRISPDQSDRQLAGSPHWELRSLPGPGASARQWAGRDRRRSVAPRSGDRTPRWWWGRRTSGCLDGLW